MHLEYLCKNNSRDTTARNQIRQDTQKITYQRKNALRQMHMRYVQCTQERESGSARAKGSISLNRHGKYTCLKKENP